MSASLYHLTANYLSALDLFTDPEADIDQQMKAKLQEVTV